MVNLLETLILEILKIIKICEKKILESAHFFPLF